MTHPLSFIESSTTTKSSPSPSIVKIPASVEGSILTYKVVVVTVAYLVLTFFASSSSPVTTYSHLTYPVTLPDVILYQPSSVVSKTVAAELLYNLPNTSLSVFGSDLTFT